MQKMILITVLLLALIHYGEFPDNNIRDNSSLKEYVESFENNQIDDISIVIESPRTYVFGFATSIDSNSLCSLLHNFTIWKPPTNS